MKFNGMYPLVNIQKTIETHVCLKGKTTIFMAMFSSYVKLPEGLRWRKMLYIMDSP